MAESKDRREPRFDADDDAGGIEPVAPVRRRTRAGVGLFAGLVAATIVIGAAAWYLVGPPVGGGTDKVPVVYADERPIKVRPEDPGGMDIPDRDKLVYERIEDGAGTGSGRVERLLPPPETPLPPPQQPAQTSPAPAERPSPAPAATPEVPTTEDVLAAKPPTPAPAPPGPAPPAPDPRPPRTADPAPPAPAPEPDPAPEPMAKTPAPAPPMEAKPIFQIQLAALRARERADVEWQRLTKKHGDLLGALQPSVIRADLGGARGVFYRLRAGPLSDEAAARDLCGKLKARRVGCLVVRPGS